MLVLNRHPQPLRVIFTFTISPSQFLSTHCDQRLDRHQLRVEGQVSVLVVFDILLKLLS
jgi:hypothetical protein